MRGGFPCIVSCVVFAAAACGDDWPQFQGPARDGSTSETVAPWKEAPPVLWRKPVGGGFSIPVISEGRVFIHAQVGTKDQEEIIALDAASGQELWRAPYPRPPYSGAVLGAGPRATPCVALGRVYSYGINGVLSCHRVSDGKRLWLVDAYKLLGAKLPTFGVCCSPLVIGNRVIVSVGGAGSSVVAFHADTGEIAWKALDEPASTTSPIPYLRPGADIPDAVFITTLRMVGLNPLTGEVSWEHALPFQPSGTTPSPVRHGNSILTSSQSSGGALIRVGEAKPDEAKAWQNADLSGYFSSPIFAGGQAYMVTVVTEPIPAATLRCVDAATGKELWKKGGVGAFHAALLRTGDQKVLLLTDAGKLLLFAPDATGFKELASAKVCKATFVAPSFAEGRLYTRDVQEVICHALSPVNKKTP